MSSVNTARAQLAYLYRLGLLQLHMLRLAWVMLWPMMQVEAYTECEIDITHRMPFTKIERDGSSRCPPNANIMLKIFCSLAPST